jgi:hypothetical protein
MGGRVVMRPVTSHTAPLVLGPAIPVQMAEPLLASFNTTGIQAPMRVRLLRDASSSKVLLITPSMADMDRLNKILGCNRTIHSPCEPGELRDHIAALQSRAAS